MSRKKHNRKHSISVSPLRPALIGFLISAAVAAALCGLFSLMFLLLNKIAQSAVLPLALLSAAAGAFAGGFVAAKSARCRGLIYGAAVGLALLVLLWFISLCCNGEPFGEYAAVKIVLLIGCGAIGGYLGGSKGRK